MKRNSALHLSSHRSSKSNDSYASKEIQMLKNVLVRGKLSLTLSPEYPVVRKPTCSVFSSLFHCPYHRVYLAVFGRQKETTTAATTTKALKFACKVKSVSMEEDFFTETEKTFKKVRKTRNRNGANMRRSVSQSNLMRPYYKVYLAFFGRQKTT